MHPTRADADIDRQVRSLYDAYLRARASGSHLENSCPVSAVRILASFPEPHHPGKHSGCLLHISGRDGDPLQPADTPLRRHRTFLPRNSRRYAGSTRTILGRGVVDEFQRLPLRVGECKHSTAPSLLYLTVCDCVFVEAPHPIAERLPTRHSEGCGRDLPRPTLLTSNGIPIEEGHICASMSYFVSVKEVIGRDVVLIDRLLHQPQPQYVGIECDIAGSMARHRGYMMQSTQIHCC